MWNYTLIDTAYVFYFIHTTKNTFVFFHTADQNFPVFIILNKLWRFVSI